MATPIETAPPPSGATLVKGQLPARLRNAIPQGSLAPGQHVVEAKWAVELGFAQGSVREAIYLLIVEGSRVDARPSCSYLFALTGAGAAHD